MSERKKRVGLQVSKKQSHICHLYRYLEKGSSIRGVLDCSASRGLSGATLRPHLLLGPSATSEQWFPGPSKHPLVMYKHHPNRFFCFLVKLLRKSHQGFLCYSQSKSQLPFLAFKAPWDSAPSYPSALTSAFYTLFSPPQPHGSSLHTAGVCSSPRGLQTPPSQCGLSVQSI